MTPMIWVAQVMSIALLWPSLSVMGPTMIVPKNFPIRARLVIKEAREAGRA